MKHEKVLFKVTALILSGVFLLTGCGGTSSESVTSTGTSGGDSTAVSTTSQLESKVLNFYYPCSSQNNQDAVFEEINKTLKAKLNCTLDLKPIDWAQWDNKYPLLLSSGEKVDLMFSASWSGYSREQNKNSFLPLDDLLEKYGKDISANIADGYLEAAKVKGKLYGIPANKDMSQGWGVVIDKAMADKIGVDVSNVKYLEDLEPILAKVKEKLPGVVPYYMSTEGDMAQLYAATKKSEDIGFRNHTKIVAMDDFIGYNVETKKAIPYYNIPEFVDQCKLVRSWFSKGYINSDTMTTQMAANDAFKNGSTFMITAAWTPISKDSQEVLYGRKIYNIELMPGIKDTAGLRGSLTVLPTSCSDPERAMMVINLAFSDKDFVNTFAYGIEGKQYVKKSENVLSLPAGVKDSEATGYNPYNAWEIGNNFLLYTWDNENPKKWDLLRDYNNSLTKSDLLGFTFDSDKVKTEVAAHKNVLSEFNRLLIDGAIDTDTVLKKMKDKDSVAGIDKICTEIESQVTAWKSLK